MDSAWTTQAARNFLMEPGPRTTGVKFLIRDRASQFTAGFDAVFLAGGIRILASPPQAPRANAICERVIGTLRREVLDRLLIVSERHLRQVLSEYLAHDYTARPHRALGQLPPAHAHSRPPKINLAEHRTRRKEVLAASHPSTRSPPDNSRPLPKDAGHRPDHVFEPHRMDSHGRVPDCSAASSAGSSSRWCAPSLRKAW
jgi:hypothetical protein